MGLLEAIEFSFKEIKEKPLTYIIGSLLLVLIGIPSIIPFIGPFITAIALPFVLRYIAKKLGFETTDRLNTSIIAFILIKGVPGFLLYLLLTITALQNPFLIAKNLFSIAYKISTLALIVAAVEFFLKLLFGYSAYGSIIKKVDKLTIDIYNGAKIILISYIMGAIIGLITFGLSLIPTVGTVLATLFFIFMAPVMYVAAIFKYIE